MIQTAKEISAGHRSMEAVLKSLVEADGRMEATRALESWRRSRPGAIVEFFYRTGYHAGLEGFVFPLLAGIEDFDQQVWLSFSLRWRSRGEESFELHTVRIAVLAGRYPQSLQPILRADWDQLTRHRGVGLPHWHVDPSMHDEGERATRVAESYAVDYGSKLSMVHLPMAGWWHMQDHPGCWQRSFNDFSDLKLWVRRVLEVLRTELDVLIQG